MIKNKWRVTSPLDQDRLFTTQPKAYEYVRNLKNAGLACKVYEYEKDYGRWVLFEVINPND